MNLDLRILRMTPIWHEHLDVVVESFNLLNRQNIAMVNPVYRSDGNAETVFTTPIKVADPRRIQFSLDFEYSGRVT